MGGALYQYAGPGARCPGLPAAAGSTGRYPVRESPTGAALSRWVTARGQPRDPRDGAPRRDTACIL
ncbi:hypothetical protein QFZ63_005238 [Streptomyces sp. B3I7]|nr:hypothetical protein [Streptomyces sp. B3I7]